MRKPALLMLLLIASLSLSACARSYPDFSSPRATIDTFFTSAQRTDYATTYNCYDTQYRATVPQTEFVSRRGKAAVLREYRVESISVNGDSASAVVGLTFAPVAGAVSKPRVTAVQERLVREPGGWKVAVQ